MKLIQTITLTSAQASIAFTSIPQTYTDLVLFISARTDDVTQARNINFEFNSSTTNQSRIRVSGNGSTVSSGTSTRVGSFGDVPHSGDAANTFGNLQAYIPNYSGNTNKPISIDAVGENNAALAWVGISASLWAASAAITDIAVSANAGNLVSGSKVSLYGILKGSDGITTAT